MEKKKIIQKQHCDNKETLINTLPQKSINQCFLDIWTARKLGIKPEELTREAIDAYTLGRLNVVTAYARENSRYYSDLRAFSDYPPLKRSDNIYNCKEILINTLPASEPLISPLSASEPLEIPPVFLREPFLTETKSEALPQTSINQYLLKKFSQYPITSEYDLLWEKSLDMLCLPASEVKRIVRVPTSGTSGSLKSVYFSQNDLELMIDYVANGLKLMFLGSAHPVLMILMPCEKPGSVGDLVRQGVERIGARTVPFGPIPPDGTRDAEVIEEMKWECATSLLGTAKTIRRLSEKANLPVESVLLSGEYVPPSAALAIEKNWNCKVYEHYGMTEMGMGCAMMCEAREGYHIREADLYVEIIDPEFGAPLPDGEEGEIVFTTLTREAHPLIRYRTGDISRILTEPCPCGSPLKRLARVAGRGIEKSY